MTYICMYIDNSITSFFFEIIADVGNNATEDADAYYYYHS